MGISLNHPGDQSLDWASATDSNWSTLESSFVARQNSDTSTVTVTGTTSETALMANASVPANGLAAGGVLAVFAGGSITIPANTAATFTWRLRWGGLSGVLLTSYTSTFSSSGSSRTLGWVADHRIFCVSAGSSGTCDVEGWHHITGAINTTYTTSLATIDTTAAKTVLWTVQLSTTSLTAAQRGMLLDRG